MSSIARGTSNHICEMTGFEGGEKANHPVISQGAKVVGTQAVEGEGPRSLETGS
jgi:hypothetical protein